MHVAAVRLTFTTGHSDPYTQLYSSNNQVYTHTVANGTTAGVSTRLQAFERCTIQLAIS